MRMINNCCQFLPIFYLFLLVGDPLPHLVGFHTSAQKCSALEGLTRKWLTISSFCNELWDSTFVICFIHRYTGTQSYWTWSKISMRNSFSIISPVYMLDMNSLDIWNCWKFQNCDTRKPFTRCYKIVCLS